MKKSGSILRIILKQEKNKFILKIEIISILALVFAWLLGSISTYLNIIELIMYITYPIVLISFFVLFVSTITLIILLIINLIKQKRLKKMS